MIWGSKGASLELAEGARCMAGLRVLRSDPVDLPVIGSRWIGFGHLMTDLDLLTRSVLANFCSDWEIGDLDYVLFVCVAGPRTWDRCACAQAASTSSG